MNRVGGDRHNNVTAFWAGKNKPGIFEIPGLSIENSGGND
jgi:hypothetical protein